MRRRPPRKIHGLPENRVGWPDRRRRARETGPAAAQGAAAGKSRQRRTSPSRSTWPSGRRHRRGNPVVNSALVPLPRCDLVPGSSIQRTGERRLSLAVTRARSWASDGSRRTRQPLLVSDPSLRCLHGIQAVSSGQQASIPLDDTRDEPESQFSADLAHITWQQIWQNRTTSMLSAVCRFYENLVYSPAPHLRRVSQVIGFRSPVRQLTSHHDLASGGMTP